MLTMRTYDQALHMLSTEFPMGGMPMPVDMHSPPLPPRGGMPHDRGHSSWTHAATSSPRLTHSQSFCAAEALTQFWREDARGGVGPAPATHHGWSVPKGGMYMLQPPPPPPMNMFSPIADAAECDSSMLSHATPLKPLPEPRPRVGPSVYDP